MNKKNTAKTNGLDTRAKILAQAKKEFLQKGFAASSLRVIAEKAGFTTGAIYNEFKNKNDIFEALVGDVFDRFIALLQHKEELSCNMKTADLEDITKTSHIRWMKKDNLKITKQTRFFVHVMVTSHFENLKEIFYHNLKKPDALQYAIDFSGYHCAGWKQYWVNLIRN